MPRKALDGGRTSNAAQDFSAAAREARGLHGHNSRIIFLVSPAAQANGNAKPCNKPFTPHMNTPTHSLALAVADGTISDERAFCGLRREDIEHLMEQHADLRVLVTLRSARVDGRVVLTVRELYVWGREPVPRVVDGSLWYTDDIRSVFAVADTRATFEDPESRTL